MSRTDFPRHSPGLAVGASRVPHTTVTAHTSSGWRLNSGEFDQESQGTSRAHPPNRIWDRRSHGNIRPHPLKEHLNIRRSVCAEIGSPGPVGEQRLGGAPGEDLTPGRRPGVWLRLLLMTLTQLLKNRARTLYCSFQFPLMMTRFYLISKTLYSQIKAWFPKALI